MSFAVYEPMINMNSCADFVCDRRRSLTLVVFAITAFAIVGLFRLRVDEEARLR